MEYDKIIEPKGNPLLDLSGLPKFNLIKPEHVKPAVEFCIAQGRAKTLEILANGKFDYANFYQPLNDLGTKLGRVFSPVSHLNAVKNSKELREAYEEVLPILTEYSTWSSQNEQLYHAFKVFNDSDEIEQKILPQDPDLARAIRKSLEHTLRGFKLSGVDLDPANKQRFGEISQQLAKLSSDFSNNVLDTVNQYKLVITDPARLKGVPQSAQDAAKALAQSKGIDGYVFTLDYPSYMPLISYCEDSEIRHQIYDAFVTRASENSKLDDPELVKKLDNSNIISEILRLRDERAHMLGFTNYASRSIETKMVETTDTVLDFLADLADKSHAQGLREMQSLRDFAQQEYAVDKLNSWDLGFYSMKQKQKLYSFDDEELRPYFPKNTVVTGLFELVKRIFGLEISQIHEFDSWHKDVELYQIKKDGEVSGYFYLDLYARENKRGGAWMDGCIDRNINSQGELDLPVAYLVCNFNQPTKNPDGSEQQALFTHNEVTTLFHEFGHGLHHMLTKVNLNDVSGINGVPWDGVELPSQFLENWCWQPEALGFISGHFETGESLPLEKLNALLAAKNYQAAMFLLRQLEFATFDFKLHCQSPALNTKQMLELGRKIKDEIAVNKSPEYVRTAHSFSHIFAGGYAAGYYSYLWAEVLSSDAFSRFEDEGIFNKQVGQEFVDSILSQGGSREFMDLFRQFRGREPKIDALLRHKGVQV